MNNFVRKLTNCDTWLTPKSRATGLGKAFTQKLCARRRRLALTTTIPLQILPQRASYLAQH